MRKKRLLSKKILHILAVAALSVSLLGGQMQAVLAENSVDIVNTIKVEENKLIFDELYVERGVALAEVELPKLEEGTLKWEDETYIPDESIVECTVIFEPKEDGDLSKYKYLDGWDAEKKIVKTKITVIVVDFDNTEFEVSEEVFVEDEISKEEIIEDGVFENEISEEETLEDINEEGTVQTPEESNEEGAVQIPENSNEESNVQLPEDSNEEEAVQTPEDLNEEGNVQTPEDSNEEEAVQTPEDLNEEGNVQIPEDSNKEEAVQIPEDSNEEDVVQVPEDETIGNIEETGKTDAPESETDASTPEGAGTPDVVVPDESKDIFNRELVYAETDHRLVTVDENISEEEKQRIAEENHCSNGIVVTGNNLPWYVQFRAYEMADAQFSINADTNVFRGFEFELWDLRTNTEYEIPEGEYVSVIVPVLEGYTYTVEHILENGAVETIIPTVSGSTLVFSTHSFSPFGIAGSTTIVGGDIMDDGYQSPTATPTPTATPKPTVTTKPAVTTVPTATTKPAVTTQPAQQPKPTVTEKPESVGGQTVLVGDEINMSGTKNDTADMTSSNAQQQSGATNGSQMKLPVQTGDTTMILPFVILVAAAFVAILVVIVLKKRKK